MKMTIGKISGESHGFSLVETLIAVTVMGVLLSAVLSAYLGTQRSAYTRQEVTEVQQNLRTAMARIAEDIRSAGFLAGDEALVGVDPASPTGNTLTIRTASVGGQFARIDQDSAPTGSAGDFRVVSAEMAALFSAGNLVRIIRPTTSAVIEEGSLPSLPLTVSAAPNLAARTIPLKNLNGGGPFMVGDLIVAARADLTAVTRIIYSLDAANRTLIRSVAKDDGTEWSRQNLASNITALRFDYVLDDDLPRTVEVTLTGTTDPDKTGKYSGVKTRHLVSSFSLRNL